MSEKFEEVRRSVVRFLEDSTCEDPSNLLNAYFGDLSEVDRVMPAEELLDLLAEGTKKPQTREDMLCAGNSGTITMGLHYAYPLLCAVLSWWVWAVLHTHMMDGDGLSQEGKTSLHEYLMVGIAKWDWKRCEHARYAGMLRGLLPPPPEPQEEKSPPGFFRRILRVLGFGKQQ